MRLRIATVAVLAFLSSIASAQSPQTGCSFCTLRGGTLQLGDTNSNATITTPTAATSGADVFFSIRSDASAAAADTLLRVGDADSATLLTLDGSGNVTVAGNLAVTGTLSSGSPWLRGNTVTLTEAGGAENVISITTATTQSFALELFYKVSASDVTPDYAIRAGSLRMACVNNAATVTCTKSASDQTDDGSVLINTNAKTLTYAIAVNVATANVATITFNIDSDMTVTGAAITWTAILNGSGTIS